MAEGLEKDVHDRLYKNKKPKKEFESPPPETEPAPKYTKQQINDFMTRNEEAVKLRQHKIE